VAYNGERREIGKFANAKEVEAVRESKKLESRTKEISAMAEANVQARRAAKKKRSSPTR
jgi:hypothetical protein